MLSWTSSLCPCLFFYLACNVLKTFWTNDRSTENLLLYRRNKIKLLVDPDAVPTGQNRFHFHISPAQLGQFSKICMLLKQRIVAESLFLDLLRVHTQSLSINVQKKERTIWSEQAIAIKLLLYWLFLMLLLTHLSWISSLDICLFFYLACNFLENFLICWSVNWKSPPFIPNEPLLKPSIIVKLNAQSVLGKNDRTD